MAEYARRTKVPADRTRLQIEELMRKRGADQSELRYIAIARQKSNQLVRFQASTFETTGRSDPTLVDGVG